MQQNGLNLSNQYRLLVARDESETGEDRLWAVLTGRRGLMEAAYQQRVGIHDNVTVGEVCGERPHLTPTQLKVMQGVHSGLLNKQIAFDLGIAEATVKAHMTALMRKLNVRNRTQVAIAAQSLNW
jgi:DNA-binding NarL/FixJ family response regulator